MSEIKTEESSNVTDLKIISNVQEFKWNFADIKQNLNSHIEKYVGLVVTEENLKDMESTQKEISSIRTKIDSFRKEVKKKMDEPYKVFEGEIKELLQLIEKAETPLKKQILEYENDRIKKLEEELKKFAQTTATNMGVRDEYFKFSVQSQWTKRTAKKNTVRKEIVTEIENMLNSQRRDDEAKEMAKQRTGLIEGQCSAHSISLGLKTPILPRDVIHLIDNVPLGDIPGIILFECKKRLDVETAVIAEAEMEAKAAAPKVELSPPVLDHVHHPDDNSIGFPNYGEEVGGVDPCPDWVGEILNPASVNIPPLPPVSRPMPPMPPTHETPYDVILKLPGVTIPQAGALKAFMASQGISYEIVSQTRRSDF
jgi:predicted metal-dependent hydrolase